MYLEHMGNEGKTDAMTALAKIKTPLLQQAKKYIQSECWWYPMLLSVFWLARRKNPCTVQTLQTADFLDLKMLSKDNDSPKVWLIIYKDYILNSLRLQKTSKKS